jgi:hypothetical protein
LFKKQGTDMSRLAFNKDGDGDGAKACCNAASSYIDEWFLGQPL